MYRCAVCQAFVVFSLFNVSAHTKKKSFRVHYTVYNTFVFYSINMNTAYCYRYFGRIVLFLVVLNLRRPVCRARIMIALHTESRAGKSCNILLLSFCNCCKFYIWSLLVCPHSNCFHFKITEPNASFALIVFNDIVRWKCHVLAWLLTMIYDNKNFIVVPTIFPYTDNNNTVCALGVCLVVRMTIGTDVQCSSYKHILHFQFVNWIFFARLLSGIGRLLDVIWGCSIRKTIYICDYSKMKIPSIQYSPSINNINCTLTTIRRAFATISVSFADRFNVGNVVKHSFENASMVFYYKLQYVENGRWLYDVPVYCFVFENWRECLFHVFPQNISLLLLLLLS